MSQQVSLSCAHGLITLASQDTQEEPSPSEKAQDDSKASPQKPLAAPTEGGVDEDDDEARPNLIYQLLFPLVTLPISSQP